MERRCYRNLEQPRRLFWSSTVLGKSSASGHQRRFLKTFGVVWGLEENLHWQRRGHPILVRTINMFKFLFNKAPLVVNVHKQRGVQLRLA